MRILHIVGSISPAAGGPTEAIRMLIRWAPAGYTSELATLDDPAAAFLAELPFPVHALGTSGSGWYRPRFLPWLRANRGRFDAVVVHGLWEMTGLGAMLTFAGRLPYIVFPHGMLDPYFKRQFPSKHCKKWIYWLLSDYWVLRCAFRVVFTTALESDLSHQTFSPHRWRSAVLPLGTEGPPAERETLREAFFAQLPALRGRRFVLFLGRIDPKKGCDLLIDAFAATAARDPELLLVMAGPDPAGWRERLKDQAKHLGIADRVVWQGMMRGNAKWGAFAAAEVFILPSHQENFGIAPVEALSSGLPVLLTRPVNIAPDVEAAGCALVEWDDLKGVTKLLERWMELSPEEQRIMRERATAAYRERYNMRRNAEAILRVFEPAAPSSARVHSMAETLDAPADVFEETR